LESNAAEIGNNPDYTIEKTLNGTTYIIKGFFDGKKTLEEIIKQRILSELQNNQYPSISDPMNARKP